MVLLYLWLINALIRNPTYDLWHMRLKSQFTFVYHKIIHILRQCFYNCSWFQRCSLLLFFLCSFLFFWFHIWSSLSVISFMYIAGPTFRTLPHVGWLIKLYLISKSSSDTKLYGAKVWTRDLVYEDLSPISMVIIGFISPQSCDFNCDCLFVNNYFTTERGKFIKATVQIPTIVIRD